MQEAKDFNAFFAVSVVTINTLTYKWVHLSNIQ